MGLRHTLPTLFAKSYTNNSLQYRSEEDNRTSHGLPNHKISLHLIFFLWGVVKDQVYKTPVRNLADLSLFPRHSSFANTNVTTPTSQLILQPFRRFSYVTAHSPTLTSQLILKPSFRFTYVTGSSPTSPGELNTLISGTLCIWNTFQSCCFS